MKKIYRPWIEQCEETGWYYIYEEDKSNTWSGDRPVVSFPTEEAAKEYLELIDRSE